MEAEHTVGQRVHVWTDDVYQYTGTVSGFGRNGDVTVRDGVFGTYCDHRPSELRAAQS